MEQLRVLEKQQVLQSILNIFKNAQVSGNVIKTIGQLQDLNTPETSELADLLKKLQTAIETDKSLLPDDKEDALEQVQALAEAGKNPKEKATKKKAKNAIRTLKGIIDELPTATEFVESCSKLLPLIVKLFGLGF
jgi:HEPN domain-containing protein